ncbi:hypothetical protein CBL_03082 [Carabus blaptoides fortunei]
MFYKPIVWLTVRLTSCTSPVAWFMIPPLEVLTTVLWSRLVFVSTRTNVTRIANHKFRSTKIRLCEQGYRIFVDLPYFFLITKLHFLKKEKINIGKGKRDSASYPSNHITRTILMREPGIQIQVWNDAHEPWPDFQISYRSWIPLYGRLLCKAYCVRTFSKAISLTEKDRQI